MIKLKLCKDCRHFRMSMNTYATYRDGDCAHPAFQFSKFSRVDGQEHTFNKGGVHVEFAREESKKCGPTGKLWEPKPPRKEFSLLGWLRGVNQ